KPPMNVHDLPGFLRRVEDPPIERRLTVVSRAADRCVRRPTTASRRVSAWRAGAILATGAAGLLGGPHTVRAAEPDVPPLAGRSPSHLMRQLIDLEPGARPGCTARRCAR